MLSDYIKNAVDEVVHLSGTRNPYDLADYLGIRVKKVDNLNKILGFYHLVLDIPYIFLNSKLSHEQIQMVLSHEIGHHLLHRQTFDREIQIETQFFSNLKMEREANEFAAHLLVHDNAIREVFAGKSILDVASEYSLLPELIVYKMNYLKKVGVEIEIHSELSDNFWKF